MARYRATIRWRHSSGDFPKGTYSREHTWAFDGGVTVPASPSPHVVPKPYSNEANVDPEEAYVAAIASCHMLTFLHLASRQKLEIASYEDDAVGVMTENEHGVPWISSVVLKPQITYVGERLPRDVEEHLHHAAHESCYIANSVKTVIEVEIDPT